MIASRRNHPILRLCALLIVCLPVTISGAQQNPDAPITTAYERALLYDGPNRSYPQQVQPLNPGVEVRIIERNRIGNWLRVQRLAVDGRIAQDGWVISGRLNLPQDLRYSAVPVSDLPDAYPESERSQSQATLLSVPIIPAIHDDMIAVFELGQQRGNAPDVITKVGDSLSAEDQYLQVFAAEMYQLGPYDYLEDTLLYYRDSTAQPSVAARVGLTTYVVFDPFWADAEHCESGESPIQCELRRKQPAVSFIMFGANDVRAMTDEIYAQQMRQLIIEHLDAGVIPVLMTFSAHPEADYFWQSINFNLQLVTLAEDMNVPLINLWAAARPLPQYGLEDDLIHLSPSGFYELKYDNGHEWFYGMSLQNLLVLRTLHEIRTTLELD